ncbi:MAG TPA: LptF/LptG family permease [Pirellulaceae bacterium]|nr:LptF/LptG family permease [Pirellulaceae bacterium]HMO90667.1 LptF/LptG family permease [Pirellulaceae bacterium]HMP67754.1 LptF/LptG family permease [Pirellulaceae bacterium]
MGIISRYLLLELIKVFAFTVAGMTGLMMLVGIVQEAIRENLTPGTIIELLPFLLPNALCFAIPGTMLFSVCLVYGRMSAANEIVAIKSAGQTPLRVLWPALLLALSLSFFTVFLNDLAVSWGRSGAYRVVLNAVEKTIYSVLSVERVYKKGNLSIEVDGVENGELIMPSIEIQDSRRVLRFQAKTAKIFVRPNEEQLVFSVKDAVAHDPARGATIRLANDEIEIPLRSQDKDRKESPSNLPLRSMTQELQTEMRNLDDQQRLFALQAAMGFCAGDFHDLATPMWDERSEALIGSEQRIHRLRTEPWRRWANGFSCLCFVLLGVPLAIYLRRADFWTTFALCFLPILIAYYPLLMFGVSQAKAGRVPPFTVWMGNIVIMLVGLWLVKRTIRS